jgi:hypothetical protein
MAGVWTVMRSGFEIEFVCETAGFGWAGVRGAVRRKPIN